MTYLTNALPQANGDRLVRRLLNGTYEVMQKTALIFGITGMDGSHLADFLLKKDYVVIGVSRRVSVDTTARLCLAKRNENFLLVEGDVTDPLCVHRLIKEHYPVEIYHLAAQSHVGTSFEQPSLTFDVTAKGTLNCLEAIRTSVTEDHSIYCGWYKDNHYPRFYQASSSEMFGSAYSLLKDCGGNSEYFEHYDYKWRKPKPHEQNWAFQDENTPFLPNSPYAVAKLAAHNLVRVYRDSYGIHATSGILFNHESPRRGENFVTRKISLWVAGLYVLLQGNIRAADLLKEGFYPKIRLGNLDASRDWGYAPDYVEAMWLMLQQDKPDDYVIATGETHTVREFLETALGCIGVNLKSEDVIEFDKSLLRPSEVPYLRGDASKAKQKLGWSPKMSFDKLVRQMVSSDIGLHLGNGRPCS